MMKSEYYFSKKCCKREQIEEHKGLIFLFSSNSINLFCNNFNLTHIQNRHYH